MHNIDRTVGEANYGYNNEAYGLNPESYGYSGEFENYEGEGSNEAEFGFESGYGNEFEYGQGEREYSGEYQGEGGYVGHELSNEALEMEMATELLGVQNEMELEQFLGKLIKRVARAGSGFLNSQPGQVLGGILKSAAKKALPIAAGALGTAIAGPAGGMIGSKLGSLATNLFELELEGLSNEDKEFELSRAYIRFANDAVRQSLRHPYLRRSPRQAVRSAVVASARRWAPGLLRRRPARSYGYAPSYANYYQQNNDYGNENGANSNGDGGQASGTWYKQGNQIILNL